MALTRLGSNAGVLGGEVSDKDNAYKNFDTIDSNTTPTFEANKNYFLKGPITITAIWTITGGTITVL